MGEVKVATLIVKMATQCGQSGHSTVVKVATFIFNNQAHRSQVS